MNFWTIMLIVYCLFSIGTIALYLAVAIEAKRKIVKQIPNYDKLIEKPNFAKNVSFLLASVITSIIPLLHCVLFFTLIKYYDEMVKKVTTRAFKKVNKGI